MVTERILIVDDEETLCEVLKLNLENEGYDVDIAFSAKQALTYDLKSYSLILLDIMMGEISGIKMAKMMNVPVLGLVENMSYFKCEDCGRIHHVRNMRTLKRYGNKKICYNCCSRNYSQCHICGEYERDYAVKHFNGGARACTDCYRIFQIGKAKCAEMEASESNN